MSILTATNLGKYYGADDIFEGISVEVPHKARIALVGPNGAGKTTLLNILIGADAPTDGFVTAAKGLRIGFLPQRPELAGSHSVWEEMLGAFTDLLQMETQLGDLEHRLAESPEDDGLLHRYGDLQHRFEEAGGYTYETRIRMILQGLSFAPDDYDRPLTQLSGGQKTRALLGRLLLDSPDLLVLDEPTNHLDIAAVEWLEHFLRDFPGAVLAVSHDRYFMDVFASTIWEMDFGEIEVYRGNYSHYVQQREGRHERRLKEYQAQQEFLAKEEEYIRRNIAGQNTRQAKGKLRRLETMQKRGKILSRPKTRRSMYLKMGRTLRSGDKVLMTYGLAVGYPDAKAPLFYSPDITLYRGEVAALIGPNGVGKSTFLKTVLGQLRPLAGSSRIGASVDIGYFAQAHERLNPKNSVMDEILTVKPMPVSEARNYLGKFLFTGDDVFRPVSTLSGGERGRVALAKLALSGANFLLLDEPTNHLDIESQEILQNVLADFDGTVLLVSHDRYLIDALATQIWAAEPGKLTVFNGSYHEFVAARDSQQAAVESARAGGNERETRNGDAAPEGRKKHGLNPYQAKQRLAKVEATIHALETQLADLTDAIAAASTSGDTARINALGAAYTQAEADLHAALEEWEDLAE
ncbi:MAG: ABC-F family ATP-binding cassette domain-containing protein [Anaerolineaceae bacterium]|nr:ABC-F family ATP-binding cassette domain-containing protein [Anaerolineaceae bacterium]